MRLILGFVSSILLFGGPVPAFRLPPVARPAHYHLELTIVPNQSEFRGIARISVVLNERAKSLWLNAKDLSFDKAALVEGDRRKDLVARTSDEFVELTFDAGLGPGPVEVELAFHGELSDNTNSGLYRKKSGQDWYAFTTFTPIEARRAFPCFDEPGYKAPWRIVLHVPESDVAASNARTKSETAEPGGMKRVEFYETKPISSEVVALAVGPFDVVDAGTAGGKRIPVRILAPRGRGPQAGPARQATPGILAPLEEYTGIPYPWDKLDHVAVLDMPYGAVENPGLITYRDGILLARPERDTLERQRTMRTTMAHELAHQWFGNFVTQAWWTDVWLSEGFATWLGGKISDLELPPFERGIAAAQSRAQFMRSDAKETRAVRLEMNSRADMRRVYSGIVYVKGAAILRMVEQWVGEETFRRGIGVYLRAHALSTATTDDLAAALSKESGVDVGPVLRSFLDQPGYPVVRAQGACEFVSGDTARWTIPVCYHGAVGASACSVLSAAHPDAVIGACPQWVWPNGAGTGYFRIELPPAQIDTIARNGWDELSAPEKISIIENTAELAASRRIEAEEVYKLLPALMRDHQPAVVAAAYRLVVSLYLTATPEEKSRLDTALKSVVSGSGRR